ncbi:hypothetical protein TRFO_02752 [Tritrichomonas foetus]|uniref:Initiator binding domain-containing protein n=1 Tax=Tritrichomonas foetus TaxID=1144522 RepID=A0A1J4KZ88_9EUKA|nr:hypothetical protein TRFO_02752 [Tritrichomonas foetus]|eukprot:OHT16474.1 hypothetical protein TRFO_02752 [Tritrichomonas foetus]
MKSTKSMETFPISDFDEFLSEDSSYCDQPFLNQRNLSLTFFTGVAGSLDQIVPENDASNLECDENEFNIPTSHLTRIRQYVPRSSSMTFNEDSRLNLACGTQSDLPFTQSSYDFRSTIKGSIESSQLPQTSTLLRELSDDEIAPSYGTFIEACKKLKIKPQEVGLIPADIFPTEETTLDKLVDIFQSKTQLRLPFKLFNALKISEIAPIFEPLVGVSWLNDEIIRLNVQRFARLVGILEPNKVLFSQTGFLTKIGFQAMNLAQLTALDPEADLLGVDLIHVKLIHHPSHRFRRNSTLEDIQSIRVPTI